MSKKMFTMSVLMVVFFPVVFYFPKFFEYRYDKFVQVTQKTINCTMFAIEQEELARLAAHFDWVRLNTVIPRRADVRCTI